MKRNAFLLLLAVMAARASALSLGGTGLSLVSSAADGDRTVAVLQDASARSLTISYIEDPSASALGRIVKLRDMFYSWPDIKLDSLRFTVTGNLIEASLMPTQVMANGQDLSSYVPAGLFFSLTDKLAYDFRLTVSGLVLRIYGPYSTESELVQKMASAVANPSAFLLRSDPEYVLRRLDDANNAITELRTGLQSLTEENHALRTDLTTESANLETTRAAAMANENSSWFSKKPVPPDGVKRVVELKKADPTLTVQVVSKQLKADGIKMTDQEIKLVFKYYFNEF